MRGIGAILLIHSLFGIECCMVRGKELGVETQAAYRGWVPTPSVGFLIRLNRGALDGPQGFAMLCATCLLRSQ